MKLEYSNGINCSKSNTKTVDEITADKLCKRIQKRNLELYEILKGDTIIRPYFDVDGQDNERNLVSISLDDIMENQLSFLNNLLDCTNDDWAISEEQRQDKSSFHLVNTKYHTTMKYLKSLANEYADEYDKLYIDKNVYKPYQKFRMIYCPNKGKNSKGLVPKTFLDNLENHFITVTKKNNLQIYKNEFKVKPVKIVHKVDKKVKVKKGDVNDVINGYETHDPITLDDGRVKYRIKKPFVCPFRGEEHSNENQYLEYDGLHLSVICHSEKYGCKSKRLNVWTNECLVKYTEEKVNREEIGLSELYFNQKKDMIKSVNETTGTGYYSFNKVRCIWEKTSSKQMIKNVSNVLPKNIELLIKYYNDKISENNQKISKNENSEEKESTLSKPDIKKITKRIERYNKIKKRTEKFSSTLNIFKYIQDDFYDPEFQESINSKFDIIPIKDNLMLDLKTMTTRERKYEDRFTFEFPITKEYIEKNGNTWRDTKMGQCVADYFNDETKLDYFHKLLGYIFIGYNVEKLFLIFYGSTGNNAKTFLFQILDMIYSKRITKCSIVSAIDKCVVTNQKNKSFNYVQNNCSDINESNIVYVDETHEDDIYSVDKIKNFTSRGGILKTRKMKENPMDKKCNFQFILALNNELKTDGFDTPMDNRTLLVWFENFFVNQDKFDQNDQYCKLINTDMYDILREDYQNTLLYFIMNANRYLNGPKLKDTQPKEWSDKYFSMRQSNEFISQFIDDELIKTQNNKDRISAVDMVKQYAEWCRDNKQNRYGSTRFYNELRLFGLEKKKMRIGGKNATFGFSNIRLRNITDEIEKEEKKKIN